MRAGLLSAWVQSFPVALNTGLLKLLDANGFSVWASYDRAGRYNHNCFPRELAIHSLIFLKWPMCQLLYKNSSVTQSSTFTECPSHGGDRAT